MLKRLSSLVLVLVIGNSILAGAPLRHEKPACDMAGMELMPGMDAMPCCDEEQIQSAASLDGSTPQCCLAIPQEPGSSGTSFNLRSSSFSSAVIHPALAQFYLHPGNHYESSPPHESFLPNLQASYIRNLSLLI